VDGTEWSEVNGGLPKMLGNATALLAGDYASLKFPANGVTFLMDTLG